MQRINLSHNSFRHSNAVAVAVSTAAHGLSNSASLRAAKMHAAISTPEVEMVAESERHPARGKR